MASQNAPSGIAEVNRLAELIVASVNDVVSEYQDANSDIPSLLSTEGGPFDAPHLQSSKLAKALLVIEAACAQLTYTLATPGHVITNVRGSVASSIPPVTDHVLESIWGMSSVKHGRI